MKLNNIVPIPQRVVFSYTGADQTYVVPSGVTSFWVYMWGAGGGGGLNGGGGAGAMVQGVLAVTPGETLTIVVGQAGDGFVENGRTYGGGGNGGRGDALFNSRGGGRSAIRRGTTDIVTVGAGGGGRVVRGGKGGLVNGYAPSFGGATGGTQTAGGVNGGSLYFGGNSVQDNNGGGGSGYYGGGGGPGQDRPGAGGSSLTSNLTLIPGETVFGFESIDGAAAPNTSSPYYQLGVGFGGIPGTGGTRGGTGGNGLVVICYSDKPAIIQFRNIPFFSPTQISGLQLWLDAYDSSTFTLSGTAVTQWNDKSGLSNNATQSSAGNRPNYNSVNRNVSFTPTSAQFLNLPNSTLPTGNTSYAYFIVCAWAQAADGLGVIGGGNYGNTNQVFALRSFGGSRQMRNYWWGNDLDTGTNAYDVNVPLIVECTYTAGGARAILTNGTQLVTDNPGARNQAVGNNTVAKTFGGEYMNGTISEIIVYNGALTVAQRQQVEGYLAWKWGLQSFLPANHPDKNNILAFIGNTTLTNQIPLRIRFTNAPPIPPLQQGTITTFSYTGSAQNYTVPSNSTRLWVHLWGAGGGGGGSTDAGAWNGGAGAYVSGILNVTPGETLRIVVGLGGSVNTTTTATLDRGGGGAAGNPPNACSSGGGRSAIQRGLDNDIVVAGGGSGSGWRQGAAATWFGTSGAGTSVNGANGGGGGTQTAGGAAGVVSGYSASTAGSKGQGGTGGGYASGGGGGWYGGGGGGVSPGNGGTGGAGSSYIDLLSSPSGQNGGVPTAPATTSSYYGGGAAAGGQIGGPTTGGNGRIVLIPVIS